ncbi:putative glutaredoxin [Eremomyces bilateralis CBS 781.70]|uniref:Glutaredoxin-like protein n=1 Tax=Eremomyces bilateralis CBS 781.70 TaxID=1392243 RepID=A0A6G1GGI0_9PEZI|nr:putative glutaredoxin [Eremomyces bilateralis CBS 781.70]KAF1817102.1 putative glutaredoxin [Eremomyces bilateralis CBS 781.70]
MIPTRALYHHAARITLFSRASCSLCADAKQVLSRVWDRQPFEYQEIDVMKDRKWAVYEFDVPVIHVESNQNGSKETSMAAPKLMHRFSPEQVEDLLKKLGK